MNSFQTIGVIGKRGDARATATLRQLCEQLGRHGREVVVETATAMELAAGAFEVADVKTIAGRCDLAVVVGGDGTLLDAGRALAPSGVPILGVNQGRLGFLVDVRPEDMQETLESVFRGEFLTEDRPLLETRVRSRGTATDGAGLPLLAVNDVVIRNLATIRMLEFETWLGEEFISAHRADGLIVCTPTGSTAYALSGGGPVLHPGLEAIALVPICPHTLSDRPIVVGANLPIRIVMRGDVAGATVTCDGQINSPLSLGDEIVVARSLHALRLIHPRSYNYFDLLRTKLQWGRSPASPSNHSQHD